MRSAGSVGRVAATRARPRSSRDLTNHDAHRAIPDGWRYGFVTRSSGRHLATEGCRLLVTGTPLGRVLEVDRDSGEVVFEFVNAYDLHAVRALHGPETLVVDADTTAMRTATECPARLARGECDG